MCKTELNAASEETYRWKHLLIALLQLGLFGTALGTLTGGVSAVLFVFVNFILAYSFSFYAALLVLMVSAVVGAVMGLPGGILLGWAAGFIRNRLGLLLVGMLCGVIVYLPFLEGPRWYDPSNSYFSLHIVALASGGITGFLAMTLRWQRLRPMYVYGIRCLDYAIPQSKSLRHLRFAALFLSAVLFARWVGFVRNYGREKFPLTDSRTILREIVRLHDEAPWYLPKPDDITLVDSSKWHPGKQATLVRYIADDELLLGSSDPHSGWSFGWEGVTLPVLRQLSADSVSLKFLHSRGHRSVFKGQHRRIPSADETY